VIDAALVVSNDSDLALAVRQARSAVPVGVINPTTNQAASPLKVQPGMTQGLHWGRRLTIAD
jgi:hypothetical protein